jgi:hypothetical protein
MPTFATATLQLRRAALVRLLVSRWLHLGILSVGVLLRVARYLSDRSLWLDEAYLALNLMNRSYSGLTGTLDFGQGGPLGFLLAEKVILDVLGDGERALRLLPFAAGIASLFLFYGIARRVLTPLAVPFALALFAVGEPFVDYSVMLKHYSFDLAVALALVYILLRAVEQPAFQLRHALLLTAAGAAAVWLSHPAAFVLAGVGAGLIAALLIRGDRRGLVTLTVPFAAWLVSFGAMFAVTLRNFAGLAESATGFASIFGSPHRNLFMMFRDANLDLLHWSADGLAPAVALIGVVAMWSQRNRPWVVAGGVMVAATLAAGYLGLYAVGQRFILFLVPFAVLCLAEGAVRLVGALPRNLAATFAVLLAGVVLLPPIARAAGDLRGVREREQIEPALAYLGERWRDGDALYVSSGAQYALRYYLECSACGDAVSPRLRAALRVLRPRGGANQRARALVSATPAVEIGYSRRPVDITPLVGRPRVWVLFTHYWPLSTWDVLEPLTELGRVLECSPVRGKAFTCLYDLSRSTDPTAN